MASQVTNYQCPACMGPLHYVGASGKLECDYCGSTYTVQEIEALYADKVDQAAQAKPEQWITNNENASWDQEAEGLRLFNCPSCGAELICDETTAATSCPYCGNPSIIPGQFHGMRKPDYILPFKLSREDAISALKKFYKGKKLLPKAFADANHIEEIKGVYVPFWLFNGEADADVRFSATIVNSYVRGKERITETDHFEIERAGSVSFSRVPVDASSKMPDAHMDAIEPFDYRDLKPFSTAYLPGYIADVYDEEAEACAQRADERAKNTAVDLMARTVHGYTTCRPVASRVELHRGRVDYALMPVWMLSTRWQGESFLFAMNGQTGRLIGDLPVDNRRFWGMFAAVAVPVAAIIGLLLQFL